MSTTRILQFTGADLRVTKLGVSSNVEVGSANLFVDTSTGYVGVGTAEPGQALDVSGNVQVGTANLFVDTTTGNVGIGITDPGHNLDIVSEMNLRAVSNTASIKYNSNVVTEYVRSKKLIKYPRVAMTSTSQDGYVVTTSSSDTSSSRTTHGAFDGLFDDSFGLGWQSGTRYSTTTGLPNSNADNATFTVNGVDYTGQWVKLQLPTKICVKSILLSSAYNTDSTDDRRPENGAFLGSNDDTNWELITSFKNDLNYTDSVFGQDSTSTRCNSQATISGITNTSHYKYIMLVVTKIATTNQYGPVHINELEYYGIPEYDPEAHGTDVIMRSVPNVPNTDFLEVYYDANDSSNYTLSGSDVTAVSDLSTNSRDCTASGVTIDSTWNAFRFDGSTSEIKVEDFTISGGDFVHTISLWLNMDEVAGKIFYFGADVSSGSAATDGVSALTVDGSGYLKWYFVANDTTYNIKLVPNTWYHIVLVYPGGSSNYQIVYVNGQPIPAIGSGNSSNPINLPTTIDLFLGRGRTASISRMMGMIANFRIQNRALTDDEVWQLYAYQKDYFQVSPDVVTFKGGRLGIGTLTPTAPLDVMGIPYGPASRPSWSRRRGSTNLASGNFVGWNLIQSETISGFNSTGDTYTVQVAGYYYMNVGFIITSARGTFQIFVNGAQTNGYTTFLADPPSSGYCQLTGSLVYYFNVGDTIQIYITGGTFYGNQHNWFTGFHLGF